MKEWSVSERRAGWSFGRHNVLFGLSALDRDLDTDIPFGFRQLVYLKPEVAASRGEAAKTAVLTRNQPTAS